MAGKEFGQVASDVLLFYRFGRFAAPGEIRAGRKLGEFLLNAFERIRLILEDLKMMLVE